MKILSPNEALQKAQSLCSQSEYCVYDMEQKLVRWGMEAPNVAHILQQLIDEKYIDEARYCKAFVNDRFKFSKWGRIKIAQALSQKRINKSLVELAFDTIDETAYTETLKSLLTAKRRQTKGNSDFEINNKLIRFASGRGFETALIMHLINVTDNGMDE